MVNTEPRVESYTHIGPSGISYIIIISFHLYNFYNIAITYFFLPISSSPNIFF